MNGRQYAAAAVLPRFDFAPLDAAFRELETLAELAEVPMTVLYHARARGLSLWLADRLACAAGLHPVHLWPDWYDRQTPEPMKAHAHYSKAPAPA